MEDKYQKGTIGWLREQAKKDGFGDLSKWNEWKIKKNIKNIELVEKIVKGNNIEIKDRIFYDFWSKVDIKSNVDECWNWMGSLIGEYGQFSSNTAERLAHRISYMLTRGRIPDGLWVLHVCNNRGCCNPSHLELGDNSKNMIHRTRSNRQPKGEDCSNTKLTEEQVREIHKIHNGKPQIIQGEIGDMFGISQSAIGQILNGYSWVGVYKEMHELRHNKMRHLTKYHVREIHKLYIEQKKLHPGYKHWQIVGPIAKKFDIAKSTIDQILNGTAHQDIYEELRSL